MLAQVVLTPSESKKLIAKAIASMEIVKQAAVSGTVLLHPSSSTYFIVEEITGSKPPTNYWVCGVVTARGMCVEMGMIVTDQALQSESRDPGTFRGWWAVHDNHLLTHQPLSSFLEQMTPDDVFIKGVNALDSEGHVGILIGDPLEGGTLGRVMAAWHKTKFTLVFPAGLEKLIPTPIQQAVKEAKQTQYELGMGMPTGLFPCPDDVVITEIDAFYMLSGATAVPVAAGGLGDAQGAVTLVIKGTDEQVSNAFDIAESCKGASLPDLRLGHCQDCPVPDCKFPRVKSGY